jgi:hypothetical protein
LKTRFLSRTCLVLAMAALPALSSCGPARSPSASSRAPLAQKWLDRAKASYGQADMDDAWDSAKSAMQAAPGDLEIRTWAGRVALARLEYAQTLQLLKGIDTTEARGLRGRARWYAGEVDAAADELEAMLQDPEVHDGWAKAIAALARRGSGRKPFRLNGGLLAVSEMPRIPGSPALVVPLEIDGEEGLALVATGTAEVTLDSAARKEPSWVSLRFGGKIEVKDVPAMVQDLSGISRQFGMPIKALLGVNLLRHVNVTFDYIGGQFIVRNFTPPIPPQATRIAASYVKGGGMVVKSAFSADKNAPSAALLLDSSMLYPLALDEGGWKKAGVELAKLEPMPQETKLKRGTVPFVRLGAFDIPQVPAVFGTPINEIEKGVEIDLDGVVGSGLLAAFRVSMTDDGRAMWLEDLPMPQNLAPSNNPPPGAAPPTLVPPGGLPPPSKADPKAGKGAGRPSGGDKAGSKPNSKKGSDEAPPAAR